MRTPRFVVRSVAALLAGAAVASVLTAGAARADGAPTVGVIVRAADAAAAAGAVARVGGDVTHDLPIIDGVAASVPADAVDDLRVDPRVVDVTEDAPVEVQADPSPLHAATAVYPRVVGAQKLWAKGVDGRNATVAVIDTGISPVPDLAGRLVGGIDFSGEDDPFRDSFGHGTFVAGLIAGDGTSSGGAYKGVAPKANLVSVKIAGRDGSSDVSHLLAALQWVVSFRDRYAIRVVNLSLGTDSTQHTLLSPLNYAVERAWDSGIVVTVSSSNNGPGAGTVTKPGDDPLVITVGAVDDIGTVGKNDDLMAGFSGQGPTRSNGIDKPDIVAPGRSVISLRAPGSAIDSAYPGSRVGSAYFKGSGTSFSTAVVSGSAALLLQREPFLTPDQVKNRLRTTATPGPVGNRNVDGYGSLDVAAASASVSLASANTGVLRSTGTGTLDLDRGTLQVEIVDDTLLDPVYTVLTGGLTAQNKLFDAVEYTGTSWSGSRWYDSQWAGSRWYGSRWYGSRWYGSRWYDNSWYGSRWYGIAWE